MSERTPPAIPRDCIHRLYRAAGVCILTGAGTSAESGIPTFREAQTGLWSRYRPEELATPQAFRNNPERVWEWYEWRRERVRNAAPNAGHYALAELQKLLSGVTLVTQNVDGLHQRAGSTGVVELHGNILRNRCSHTGKPIADLPAETQQGAPPASPHHPLGRARPDVVWFGEPLPAGALEKAFAAAGDCEICMCVGTSALVEPAASIPRLAVTRGAALIEINTEPTPLSDHADWVLRGPSGVVLPALVESIRMLTD